MEEGTRALLLKGLSAIVGDRMSTLDGICREHGRGEGMAEIHPPDVVVYPISTGDVSAVVSLCASLEVPVVPFGAGSSLEGQVAALHGGVCLDFREMNRILDVSAGDLDCRVEAGVTREQLNQHIRDSGLFFPLDPGYNATLGGMASTRASGTNAVRYGTMRDVTLGLTVVGPDGGVYRTGMRARKSAAGYDLTRLIVGAEGTLGIITELQLRIFGIPEKIASGYAQFPDVEHAVDAVITVMQLGIPMARIELLDELQMSACIAWSGLTEIEPRATLFVEFHGTDTSVEDQIENVAAIFADHGADNFHWAQEQEDRTRLWKARHDAYHAARSLAPGCESRATDACVPLSALADAIRHAQEEARRLGLQCPIVGHVGDGNFHCLVLFDSGNAEEATAADEFTESVAYDAIARGGTCTGEHGIGYGKLECLRAEAGEAIRVMQAIKQALDPKNIMNPGKTVPL